MNVVYLAINVYRGGQKQVSSVHMGKEGARAALERVPPPGRWQFSLWEDIDPDTIYREAVDEDCPYQGQIVEAWFVIPDKDRGGS